MIDLGRFHHDLTSRPNLESWLSLGKSSPFMALIQVSEILKFTQMNCQENYWTFQGWKRKDRESREVGDSRFDQAFQTELQDLTHGWKSPEPATSLV